MSIQNFLTNNDNLLVRDDDEQDVSSTKKPKRSFFFGTDRETDDTVQKADRSDLLYVSSKGYFFQ